MCSGSNVGKSKKSLKVCIEEHQDHLNKNAVVANHIKEMSHMFDWENVENADHDSNWQKLRVSEMLFIDSYYNSLNKKENTLTLFHIYKPITSTLKRFCFR